eukprot:1999592-Pyramimonas_sp.AAC.2
MQVGVHARARSCSTFATGTMNLCATTSARALAYARGVRSANRRGTASASPSCGHEVTARSCGCHSFLVRRPTKSDR